MIEDDSKEILRSMKWQRMDRSFLDESNEDLDIFSNKIRSIDHSRDSDDFFDKNETIWNNFQWNHPDVDEDRRMIEKDRKTKDNQRFWWEFDDRVVAWWFRQSIMIERKTKIAVFQHVIRLFCCFCYGWCVVSSSRVMKTTNRIFYLFHVIDKMSLRLFCSERNIWFSLLIKTYFSSAKIFIWWSFV